MFCPDVRLPCLRGLSYPPSPAKDTTCWAAGFSAISFKIHSYIFFHTAATQHHNTNSLPAGEPTQEYALMETLVPHVRHPMLGGPSLRPPPASQRAPSSSTPTPQEWSCVLLYAIGKTTQGWPTKYCNIFQDCSLPGMGIWEAGVKSCSI